MNIEEQDKELRRLRLYIMQIHRCNTSRSRRMLASWALDADFVQHVDAATALIKKAQDSVTKLRACSNDDYSGLSNIDRFRLLGVANKIRELDEETEQGLFILPNNIKHELSKLRTSCRKGKHNEELLKKYKALFALLSPHESAIMKDSYINGKILNDIAKEQNLTTSRIGAIIKESIKQLEEFDKGGNYEQPEGTAML